MGVRFLALRSFGDGFRIAPQHTRVFEDVESAFLADAMRNGRSMPRRYLATPGAHDGWRVRFPIHSTTVTRRVE